MELPTAVVQAHGVESFHAVDITQDVQQQARSITDRVGSGSAVEAVAFPESVRLELDGRPVDCKPLDYTDVRGGLALVRLVALTGYGSDEDRLRSQGAGFDYHLVKPADPKELQRLLEAR